MADKKYLIVIGGPTASGKTEIAIRLAQHFDTSIISSDSRQFFKELTIGTAKPTKEELAAAPHHFINSHSILQEYSVGDFEREGMALLNKLFQEKDVLILAGGSGLYIKALCEGLNQFPDVKPEIRNQVEQFYHKEGIGKLQEELRELDPEYFEVIDRNNPHRLIRAISVCRSSGLPFSSFWNKPTAPRFFHSIYVQLHLNRSVLYDRINQRVDLMMEAGLLEEAQAVYPFKEHTALKTVGYQELFEYFDGKTTLEAAIELIKRNSRRYAKRQLTWARRDGFWKRFHPKEWPLLLDYINFCKEEETLLKEAIVGEYPFQKSLSFVTEQKIRTQILWFQFKKYSLLTLPPSHIPNKAHEFLLHELFLRLEGIPLFAYVPTSIEPFFINKGYQSVSLNRMTSEIRDIIQEGNMPLADYCFLAKP